MNKGSAAVPLGALTALLLYVDISAGLHGAAMIACVPILLVATRVLPSRRLGLFATLLAVSVFAAALPGGLDGASLFSTAATIASLALMFFWRGEAAAAGSSSGNEDRGYEIGQNDLQQRLEEMKLRFEKLFEVSYLSFSEQDIGDAKIIFERMRSEGVTDFRSHMRDNPDDLAFCISSFQTLRVNEALARLLGYANVAELAAKPPVQNAETAFEILTDQLEMAYTGREYLEGRTVLIGKDGRRIPIFYTVKRLTETRQLTSNLDLTEYERVNELKLATQEELARANRVATMGALSASITHELNQPIVSMVLDTKNGLRWLDMDPPNIDGARRALERLSRSAERAGAIVKATRERISRNRGAQGEIVIGALIEETIELMEREIRAKQADVRREVVREVGNVVADRVGLQQVLVNFLTNAMEAMADQPPENRRVVISVDQATESLVRIKVADSGPGIEEDNIEKIFEPFFTTKTGGVGLGLQICRSTIESFGGVLKVYNAPEAGAVFEFTLPCAKGLSPSRRSAQDPSPPERNALPT